MYLSHLHSTAYNSFVILRRQLPLPSSEGKTSKAFEIIQKALWSLCKSHCKISVIPQYLVFRVHKLGKNDN